MPPTLPQESESESSSENHSGPSNEDSSQQLDDAITHLISDLPSPVINEDCKSPSPLPNAQFVKAAIYSQRLPPAALQASKLGIKDIENTLQHSGKGGAGGKGGKKKQPGPGDKADDESPTRSNGDRVKAIAEKKIPELEECPPSPPVPVALVARAPVPIAEKKGWLGFPFFFFSFC